MTNDFQEKARRLRNAVEPVAAGVYFAPEAHAAYEALGFDGSPAQPGRRGPPGAEVLLHQSRRVHGPGAGRGRGGRVRLLQPEGRGGRRSRPGGRSPAGRRSSRPASEGATEMLQRVLGDQPEGLGRVTELLRRGADAAPWAGRPI